MIVKVWFIPYYVQFSRSFYRKVLPGVFDKNDPEHKKHVVIRKENFREIVHWKSAFNPITKALTQELNKEAKDNVEERNKMKSKIKNVKEKEKTQNKNDKSGKNYPLVNFLYSLILKNHIDTSQENGEYYRIKRKINFKVRPRPKAVSSKNLQLKPTESSKRETNPAHQIDLETQQRVADTIFHTLRRGTGLLFILIFLWLILKTQFTLLAISGGLAILCTALVGLFSFWYIGIKQSELIEVGDDSRGYHLNTFFSSTIAIVILVIAMLFISKPETPPALSMWLFIFLILLILKAFVHFSLFRFPAQDIDKKDIEDEDKVKKFVRLDDFQGFFTKTMMRFGALFSPVVFIILLAISVISSGISYLHCLNPINYYLFIINGIICGVALIQRLVIIRRAHKRFPQSNNFKEVSKKKDDQFPIKSYALIATIVLAIIALASGTNYHHEINYVSQASLTRNIDDENQNNPYYSAGISFEQFTRRYLDEIRDSTQVARQKIYFVAAEGGGLRAAYWTMMVLDKLPNEVRDNIFMMTGASGGGIGMGMYNFMLANDIDSINRQKIIQKIGSHNFLTTDAAGILTRGVGGSILSFPFMKNYWDRHRYMAKTYFDLTNINSAWTLAGEKPFHTIWQNQTSHLPMLVVNATRTIDGSRAVVHPFGLDEGRHPFTDHYIDLSMQAQTPEELGDLSDEKTPHFITYADAVFLTNRFPFVSPPARISGSGYYVDGGYYENSGLQTVLHTLGYMQGLAEEPDTTIFDTLFNQFDIEVINIRNSSSAYYQKLVDSMGFTYRDVNLINSRKQVGNILGATAGGGLSALPAYYHTLLGDFTIQQALEVSNYITIDLPYLLHTSTPLHDALDGQIVDDKFSLASVVSLNDSLINHELDENIKGMNIISPPLGRRILYHTREYMQDMLGHPSVESVITALGSNGKSDKD
ncbi:MAG: patatin-like phospholipase family protein [Bacteroidota bacterium]